MVRVVLDYSRSAQHGKHIIQYDILFYHLLMGVRRDAKIVSLRLKGKAGSDSRSVARIHVNHNV